MSIYFLVEDIDQAIVFQADVLKANDVYLDPDFALTRGSGSNEMVQGDFSLLTPRPNNRNATEVVRDSLCVDVILSL